MEVSKFKAIFQKVIQKKPEVIISEPFFMEKRIHVSNKNGVFESSSLMFSYKSCT